MKRLFIFASTVILFLLITDSCQDKSTGIITARLTVGEITQVFSFNQRSKEIVKIINSPGTLIDSSEQVRRAGYEIVSGTFSHDTDTTVECVVDSMYGRTKTRYDFFKDGRALVTTDIKLPNGYISSNRKEGSWTR